MDEDRVLHDRLKKTRVDEGDILTAARERQGLERMAQIKYAVLERSGGISIIPWTGRPTTGALQGQPEIFALFAALATAAR